MKKRLPVAALALLVFLVSGLVALRIVGFEPRDDRPGFWIKGQLVTTPIADWSFTDRFVEIYVETRTWYLLPHSVTISCTAHNGRLYLTSTYSEGGEFPSRYWNKNVVRDPRVRLKIGNQLFERTLSLVTDVAEKEAVLESKRKKAPQWKSPGTENVHIFRVL
jgi:hypothetical protein